ncbi:MAG: ROK family protein [Gammaproteobacteria bacterium]|nr:ROK family protein [Gammaproteobacteria bacterium]
MKIGIDLGGTKIEIVALQENNTGQYQELYRQRCNTPQGQYQQTIDAIIKLINDAETKFQTHASVGIGIPGAISAQTGLVKNANSTCLIGQPLQKDLEKKLSRPIRISNDANCLAVSEATNGNAQNAQVVFGVILGTGVGGGIVINQQVIEGKNLIAGEWGHNPLPVFKPIDNTLNKQLLSKCIDCYCGKKDCIETHLSGPGLLKRYKLAGGKAENVPMLIQHAEQGIVLAQVFLQQYQLKLAMALASIINIIDPDIIVLGGGLSNINSIYDNIPNIWQQYIFSDQVKTDLKPALHGDSSGVFGAAFLW